MNAQYDQSSCDTTNDYQLYIPNQPYTASELSAMAYHGMLRPQFGPYYVDIDLPDTAAQRARSVRIVGESLFKGSWTATLLTAAWIHLGGPAPELFEAAAPNKPQSPRTARIMPSAIRQTDYLQRPEVSDDELQVIGGVLVTGQELTIRDLLRLGGTQRHQQRAYELLDHVDIEDLPQHFDKAARLPDMGKAYQLLELLILRYQAGS